MKNKYHGIVAAELAEYKSVEQAASDKLDRGLITRSEYDAINTAAKAKFDSIVIPARVEFDRDMAAQERGED